MEYYCPKCSYPNSNISDRCCCKCGYAWDKSGSDRKKDGNRNKKGLTKNQRKRLEKQENQK